jgi:hypothetical protein
MKIDRKQTNVNDRTMTLVTIIMREIHDYVLKNANGAYMHVGVAVFI